MKTELIDYLKEVESYYIYLGVSQSNRLELFERKFLKPIYGAKKMKVTRKTDGGISSRSRIC